MSPLFSHNLSEKEIELFLKRDYKGCPFCGKAPSIGCADPGAPYPGGYYFIACDFEDCPKSECSVEIKGKLENIEKIVEILVERWNTRYP